jgi:hypothetical protein
MDDRRPPALRARPPRGAPRPRARLPRDSVVGRVVVVMRDSGDELEPGAPASGRAGRCCLAGMATGSALAARCVNRGWLRVGRLRARWSGPLTPEDGGWS